MTLIDVVHPGLAEERRLWTTKLNVPERSLGQEIHKRDISHHLNFDTPLLKDLSLSVEQSDWFMLDGKHLVEVRSLDNVLDKLDSLDTVYISDFDDTILRTSAWHAREYELVAQYLNGEGIMVDAKRAKEIYELSKIFIPGIADVQARYTPRLNLIFIDEYKRRILIDGFDPEQAWEWLKKRQQTIQQDVTDVGEGVLRDYRYDRSLQRRLIAENPTHDYVNVPLVRDLFDPGVQRDDGVIRIIITRGKINNALGQVYKVHQSGVMELPGVDMVIYTDDIKMNALLSLLRAFPWLRNASLMLFDDNPGEIVPFYEQIAKQGVNLQRVEVVQVRHSDSKRRDKKVMVPGPGGILLEKTPFDTVGYRYPKNNMLDQSVAAERFDEAGPDESVTIFDHHMPGEKMF